MVITPCDVTGGRPKLLFLACFFPPLNTMACVRAWNVAKYLRRLGWDVTVVTPDPSIWRSPEGQERVTLDLEREGIRRLLTGHQWRGLVSDEMIPPSRGPRRRFDVACRTIARQFDIDRGVGWIPEVLAACAHLVPTDVDVILATGSPFASFSAAKQLADRLGRPFVLDYRDPWTVRPHAAHPPRPSLLRKEARLVQTCSAVTIVSESWAKALDARLGLGAKLHVVTNGYDAEELVDVQPQSFDHFAIAYAGGFYPPKRCISPLMAALRELKNRQDASLPEWRFHYYGSEADLVRDAARQADVLERVVFHGTVSRSTALAAVRGAGLAIVITSILEESSLEDQGIVPGKLFEAIGLGTPVLLIAPPDSNAGSIVETTGLARRFAGRDVAAMAAYLAEVMQGRAPRPINPEAYTWTNIGRSLDTVLRRAAGVEANLSAGVV